MITGGVGGIALALARSLFDSAGARLTLISRSACNNDPRAAELRDAGAEVLTIPADVTSVADMERAIARTLEVFGTLNGVVHAAGLPGNTTVIRSTRESAAAVLAPKVTGARLLDEVL